MANAENIEEAIPEGFDSASSEESFSHSLVKASERDLISKNGAEKGL